MYLRSDPCPWFKKVLRSKILCFFMVYGLWFMVYGLWVYGLWFMVYGFMVYGFMVYGLGFRV